MLDVVHSGWQRELQIRAELNRRLDLEREVDAKQTNRVLHILVGAGSLLKHLSTDPSSPQPKYTVASSPTTTTTVLTGASADRVEAQRLREDCLEQRRTQVLEVLESRRQEGGEPMGTLELVRRIGLSRKADVNCVLSDLRNRRLVDEIPSSTGPPRWYLSSV